MQKTWRKRKRGAKAPTISVDQSFFRKGTKRNSDDVTCEDIQKFMEKFNAVIDEECRILQENGVNRLNVNVAGTTKSPLSANEQAFLIAAERIKESLKS
jgi:hypothetical protein